MTTRTAADRGAAAARGRARKEARRLAADEMVVTTLNAMLMMMQVAKPEVWHHSSFHAADWTQVQALLRVIAHYKLKAGVPP